MKLINLSETVPLAVRCAARKLLLPAHLLVDDTVFLQVNASNLEKVIIQTGLSCK